MKLLLDTNTIKIVTFDPSQQTDRGFIEIDVDDIEYKEMVNSWNAFMEMQDKLKEVVKKRGIRI